MQTWIFQEYISKEEAIELQIACTRFHLRFMTFIATVCVSLNCFRSKWIGNWIKKCPMDVFAKCVFLFYQNDEWKKWLDFICGLLFAGQKKQRDKINFTSKVLWWTLHRVETSRDLC